MTTIRCRNGTILHEGEHADVREAVEHCVREGANLAHARLAGASLTGADLVGARLAGADLRDARLVGARLDGASLRDARGLPALAVPGLARRVLAQIEQHPETHDQSAWHSSCGTRHCAAGWTVRLAEVPAEVEARLGTAHAATLALGLSLGTECPWGSYDDPIPWLRELADQ